MTSYCCVTWEVLAQELAQAKIDELAEIKGVPKSVFASTYKVLEQIDNYCPVCGIPLKAQKTTTTIAQVVEGVEKKGVKPETARQAYARIIAEEGESAVKANPPSNNEDVGQKVKCPACKGKGITSVDSDGVEMKCMSCLGEGTLDKFKHIDKALGNNKGLGGLHA